MQQDVQQRHTFDDQAHAMAELLSKRRRQHVEIDPVDAVACRAISQLITYSIAFILIMLCWNVLRTMLGI